MHCNHYLWCAIFLLFPCAHIWLFSLVLPPLKVCQPFLPTEDKARHGCGATAPAGYTSKGDERGRCSAGGCRRTRHWAGWNRISLFSCDLLGTQRHFWTFVAAPRKRVKAERSSVLATPYLCSFNPNSAAKQKLKNAPMSHQRCGRARLGQVRNTGGGLKGISKWCF